MNERQRRRWQATRNRGQRAFIIRYGVLGWGMGTGLLWSLAMQWLQPAPSVWQWPLVGLIIFPIGGLFWGKWMWRFNERDYYRASTDA